MYNAKIIAFALSLQLVIFVRANSLFIKQLKEIWYAGGIGVTYISNPYDYNDHYNVCLETCRMSISCWMSGGLKVSGNCDSIFYVCCKPYDNPTAEARKLSFWDDMVPNHIDEIAEPAFQDVYYGPVVNEPNCGRQTVAGRRVVGGNNAGFGTYPWQVPKLSTNLIEDIFLTTIEIFYEKHKL